MKGATWTVVQPNQAPGHFLLSKSCVWMVGAAGFSTRQGSEREHGGGSGIWGCRLGDGRNVAPPVPNPRASFSS